MKIAIDASPLKSGHYLWHRVRGTGFYVENLKNSLLKFYPDNDYIFFSKGEELPKDTDLVHVPYFEPFFLTLPLKKTFKTVITVHDLTPLVFPKHFPAGVKGKLKWQIQKRSLKKADAVITDSESSKNDIIKYIEINPKKIHRIYLAAGEEFKRIEKSEVRIEKLKKKYNLPERFVLYVGDATWNKNLPRLLEAIKLINVPLIMVGKALTENSFDQSNPWNKDLVKVRQLIKENKNIMCLGFVPTEDLIMIYNIATVFVMPSLYEGFGLPVLEAMSCGCPVITSKGGSLPEVAGDAGFYVDADNTNSIAKGIRDVFSSEKMQKELSQKGLTQAKKFSWRKTAREMIEVYKRVYKVESS